MRESKSITNNAILNGLKTVLSIIFPIITYPYACRTLHATNLGKVTFAQAFVSYFALIASLGINTYAVREGAKKRGDKEDLQRFCNEVFTTNIITTAVAYAFLFLTVLFVPKVREYSTLISIISLTIIATTIGIEWLNVVFEDFLLITVRSMVVQVVNLILLYVIVRDEEDYYKYAFLLVLSNVIVCVWNLVYCRKYIRLRLTLKPHIKQHIKPLFVFFANNLAVSIYCYADTTMLGWLVSDACVGIYSAAVKAYTVVKTVLSSIYTVCIPRLSDYYAKGDYEKFKQLINILCNGIILVLFPGMTGLIVLAKPVIMFLGGPEYVEGILTLKILSVALLFAIVGGLVTNCINIATGKEKITLLGTIIAAGANICLNIVLIPVFKQNGAAITTVIAEVLVVVVCCLQNKEISKLINISKVMKTIGLALIGSLMVFISHYVSALFDISMLLQCIVTMVLSVILYSIILLTVKNEFMLICVNWVLKVIKAKQRV